MIELNDIDTLLDLAYRAGEEILAVYQDSFSVVIKDDDSPLTQADTRAHAVIQAGLQEHFPEIPIVSEEGELPKPEERKAWQYFWLVDPLDGTKEFVKRNGEFTVNIALIHGDKPIFGLISAPVLGVTYLGLIGEGAWKIEGTKPFADAIPMPIAQPERPYTAVISRSHLSPETEEHLKVLQEKYGTVEKMNVGSSIKFCMVAEGKADIYFRTTPTMEWDTAAGHAIAAAAGANVTIFPNGRPLTYNKETLKNDCFMVYRQD